MQMNPDLVFTDFAQIPGGQPHIALFETDAGGYYRLNDIKSTDRAEQLAFTTGLGADGNGAQGVDFFLVLLGGTQRLIRQFFQFSTTRFEFLEVFGSRRFGLALR